MSIPNLETIKLLNRFSTKVKNNFNCYENPKYHISKLSNNSLFNDNLSKANILEIRNLVGFKTTFQLDKPQQGNKYTISFGLSFFCENPENDNSETSLNKKIFFGNSYRTKRIEISIDEVNNITFDNQNNNLQIIFFNTEQFEFQIGIEIILNEVPEDNDEIIINEIVLGWSIINTKNVSPNDSKAPIYKGTIRDLICHPEVHDTSSFDLINGADLIYIFEKNNNDVIGLNDMKFLIPQYYFIGNSNQIRDYIPGLLNKYIPNNIHDINDKVKLSRFQDIYLKNLDIEFPNMENVDKYLINDYKEYKGIPLNENLNAHITDSFCKCYIHNTFRQLIKREPEKIILTKKNDHLINQDVIKIENYFVDEMGFCAIIIELFFSLKINETIVDYPIGITHIIPNHSALKNTSNIVGQNDISLNDVNLLSDFRKVTFIGNNAKAKCNYVISLLHDSTDETFLDKKIENLTNEYDNLTHQTQLRGINQNNNRNTNEELKQVKEELDNTRKEYVEVYDKKPNIDQEKGENNNINFDNPNTNFIIDQMNQGDENPNINYDNSNNNPLGNTLENPISGEIHERNYFEEQKKKNLENQNPYASYKEFKDSQMNQSLKNYQDLYETRLRNNNIPYEEQEKVNYNDEYYQNSRAMSQKILYQDNKENVIYNTETNKNISKAEIADLINQGILSLPNDDEDINKIDIDKSRYHAPSDYDLIRANQTLLDYTYHQIIDNHLYFGDIFTFQFISFKPLPTLESYNSVPSSIYFKFTFWSFGEFQTENAEITKPIMNINIIPNNIPLFIYKQNAQFYQNSSDKDMKISISYDPSIDNNIDYKLFVKYLLYKDLFIEIFDNEKQMVYGYVKVPLKKLIRATNKRNLFEVIHVTVYDNQNYSYKGELEILLKSDETKTSNNFDIIGNANKFKYFNSMEQYDQNQEPESSMIYYPTSKKLAKKKVVSVGPMSYGKMLKKDKEIMGKNIIDSNNKGNTEEILKKKREMREKRSNAYANYNVKTTFKLDKQTEKKVRVLKYLDDENEEIRKNNSSLKQVKSINNMNNNTFIPNDILKANMSRLDKENEFYENLNYANYIKSINKQKIIEKAINESNKNLLSIALIQGQPHYFNYIITNLKSIEQLYTVTISQTKKKKNMINDSDENVVSLITDPEEFEYITKKYNLSIPEDYSFISDDYQIILKPNQSVPLLIKILFYDNITGYDDNIKNKYSICVYNKNDNSRPYYMNIEITNVFPIIDFEFYHNVPQKKLSHIKFINPFKFNNEKTQRLLNYYTFNNDDSTSEILLDSKTNNFYFKYNDNIENNSNNEDNIINKKDRLLFFYLDKYKSELFTTFKFNIKSYETIQLSTDVGIRSKNTLNIPPSTISRTIQFFSSDPDTLYFDDKYKEQIILIPNYPYTIEYILYPKENKNYEILINCVDISTNEVIKNFLIKTNPNKPAVNIVLNINAPYNYETNLQFEFPNPLNQWAILKFDSSNKKIVALDNDLIPFNPEENKYVSFRVLKQRNPGKAEAYIFVSDNEESFNQAVLLKITYFS